MDVRQRVGRNIRRLREASGRSQEEFAFDAGIHRTYVSGVERGHRNPTLTVLEKFAEALKVSVAELVR